jgi:hypothetical protein
VAAAVTPGRSGPLACRLTCAFASCFEGECPLMARLAAARRIHDTGRPASGRPVIRGCSPELALRVVNRSISVQLRRVVWRSVAHSMVMAEERRRGSPAGGPVGRGDLHYA